MQDNERGQWGLVQKEGGKRTLLAGHKEVPRGFGLRTRDHGNTVCGAGDHRKTAQLSTDDCEEPAELCYRLLLLFFWKMVLLTGMF